MSDMKPFETNFPYSTRASLALLQLAGSLAFSTYPRRLQAGLGASNHCPLAVSMCTRLNVQSAESARFDFNRGLRLPAS